MRKFWSRYLGTKCEHDNTLTVSSVGVERTVCEDCGHVSFSIAANLIFTHEMTPIVTEEADWPRAG